jgi:flagellar hook-associated protein 3 FlgL
VAEGVIVNLNSQMERNTGFTSAASSGASQLGLASQVLGQAYSVLQTAQTAALQGLNDGTMNQGDLDTLATQVDQSLNQMVDLANTKQGGESLFAGYQTQTTAFSTTTNAAGQVTGVTYQGDAGVVNAQVGESMSVQTNVTGSAAFDAAGASTFQSLIAIRDALSAGDQAALQTGLNQLQQAVTTVSAQESRAGALQATLQSRQTALGAQNNTLSTQLSAEQDTDMSTVAMQYQQALTTYQAGIQAAGLVAQMPSIVNYM